MARPVGGGPPAPSHLWAWSGETPEPLPCRPTLPRGARGRGPALGGTGLPAPSTVSLSGGGRRGWGSGQGLCPLSHPLPLRLTTLRPRSCRWVGHRDAMRPPASVQTHLPTQRPSASQDPPGDLCCLWKVGLPWVPRRLPPPTAPPRPQPQVLRVPSLPSGQSGIPTWAGQPGKPKSPRLLEAAASTLTCSPPRRLSPTLGSATCLVCLGGGDWGGQNSPGLGVTWMAGGWSWHLT